LTSDSSALPIHDLRLVELAVLGQEVAGEAELAVVGEELRDGLGQGGGEDRTDVGGWQAELDVDRVGAVGGQADFVEVEGEVNLAGCGVRVGVVLVDENTSPISVSLACARSI
jgi:hypothetical protein